MRVGRIFPNTLPGIAIAVGLTLAVQAADVSRMVLVSDNGRYLVDGQGTPFFWQGDTHWELFYALRVEDAKELIRVRKAQGFTVIQAMCDGLFPKWIPPDQLPPPGELMPWLNDDPTTPNPAFFARMDAIVVAAREEQMLLLIGVYIIDDVRTKRITLENIGPWTCWLARRYREAPNIIWSMYAPPEPASLPMVQAALQGLREGDGGSHLVTVHPEGTAGASTAVGADLSLTCLQSLSNGHQNYDYVLAEYRRTPAKPVVNVEARYEAEGGITAFDVRRSAWWSYLAGGGFSYGHIENWKTPGDWRSWVDAPGAKHVAVAGQILRSLEWWKLVPDPGLLRDAGEAVAARSADGDWILAYLPTSVPVTLRLEAITRTRSAAVSWINPATGERTAAAVHPVVELLTVTPPQDWPDAVLLVEAK